MAVANYHDDYGAFPPAVVRDEQGQPIHSWRVLLLPYLEQMQLYEEYDFQEPWNGPHNCQLLARWPAVYAFTDGGEGTATVTNYLAVLGDQTVWRHGEPVTLPQVVDGHDTPILVVENMGSDIQWTKPDDLELDTMNLEIAAVSSNGISSPYDPPAVVTVAGRIQTLSPSIHPDTLRALVTASGGEALPSGLPWRSITDGRVRPLKPER